MRTPSARSIQKATLLAGILAGGLLVLPAATQAPARVGQAPAPVKAAGTPVGNPPNHLPGRARMYYAGFWGIDSLVVKTAESGELVRFSYRVLDPNKAAPLNDKKSTPTLEDWQSGVELVVPSLEKVGQLRQASAPVAGKSYWMAFSNPGRRVKPGDRVDVVIGSFRASGLVVE